MMLFIDTNIFLEVEFKDSRWQECRDFLSKVEIEAIKAITSDFIVYSGILEIHARAKFSVTAISNFVNGLCLLNGLSIFHPTEKELLDALTYMKKYNLDFDDALVVACMMSNKIKKLVSFDTDFDKVKEIERIEPRDVK